MQQVSFYSKSFFLKIFVCFLTLYFQACHVRLTHMSDECEQLKKQSDELSRQLGRSEIEADQRKRVEQDLHGKLEKLQREQQERNYSEGLSKEYFEQLKRQLMEMEQEKKLLAEQIG